MLLIWGWKARYKNLGSGTFYCPHEGVDRPYRHVAVRRWFTFFFIPVIPLNQLGEFIECASCGSAYDERVLTMPTAAAILDNLSNAMRHAVVAMIRADEVIDDDEKETALEVMQRFSDTPYTMEDLNHDLVVLSPTSLEAEMATVAGTLSSDGKELLLAACLAIAAADGSVDDAEVRELQRAGQALGMSHAHIRGVVAQTIESLKAGDA